MILARSVWLFVISDLDKISIIEATMALPISGSTHLLFSLIVIMESKEF
jgi:hypothetical protein